MNLISSYNYPLITAGMADRMLADQLCDVVTAAGGSVHMIVTVEAATFPAAVAACAALARQVQDAGLPPLHFKDGNDACPSCGTPVDPLGTDEDGNEQGRLEL